MPAHTWFMRTQEAGMNGETTQIGEFSITGAQRRVLQKLLSSPKRRVIFYDAAADECVARGWLQRDKGSRYTLTDLGRACARQLGMKP